MTPDEIARALACECPRRLLPCLHAGRYAHGTVPAFPGKVLCRAADLPPLPGWRPTAAQAALDALAAEAEAEAEGEG